MSAKKIFFASDFHLGADAKLSSRDRERQLVRWLDKIAPEAAAIYLVGDLFEFWFEYNSVIPKGYTRFLGKLAALRDQNIPIYAFTGNHDLWMRGYFEEELGIPVYKSPIQIEINGKRFFIGHGDGLGPDDIGYKIMKKIFIWPPNQWFYKWVHPDWGVLLARFFSKKSRAATPEAERHWMGDDREWLLQYCLRKLSLGLEPDYFVFGHRHLPIDRLLPNGKSRYINLGEWMHACSYAVFDGHDMTVCFFENENGKTL